MNVAKPSYGLLDASALQVSYLACIKLLLNVEIDAGIPYMLLLSCMMKVLSRATIWSYNSNTKRHPLHDSAGVADFLRTHFERDPIGPHLAPYSDHGCEYQIQIVMDISP